MTVVRIYETRAADDETGLTARIIAVPAASIGESGYLEEPERLLAELELTVIGTMTAVDLIPALAQIMLSAEAYGEPYRAAEPNDFLERRPSQRHLSFAAYLAFQPIIPFESSPLSGVSLGALLTASPAALGAGMGFVVAGGSVPLLLVLVPAGAVIAHFGAAFTRGAARPLEQAGEDLSATILERLVSGYRYRSSSGPSDTTDNENDEGGEE